MDAESQEVCAQTIETLGLAAYQRKSEELQWTFYSNCACAVPAVPGGIVNDIACQRRVTDKICGLALMRRKRSLALLCAGCSSSRKLDPADCLMNRFSPMIEENIVTWVPWECCLPSSRSSPRAR